MPAAVDAVVFDLDGVLLDSEQAWDAARRALTAEHGGTWLATATRDMMGMSPPEWSSYVHERLGVPLAPAAIDAAVVARLLEGYRRELPLLPGAQAAVRRLAARWPLGLASSSNRPVIDLVLEAAGLSGCFRAWVSSEEVGRGKPAPDVFEEAARRLGVDPRRCVAIEDSHNGIRSAHAAGMRVVALPNVHFPPDDQALAAAHAVIGSLDELTPAVVERAAG